MEIKKQFTIALENKPGELASLCGKFSKNNVNIEAISVINTQEMGFVRIVADNAEKASVSLKGYNSAKEEVAAVKITNKPGELAKLARTLSENDINIEYTYGSAAGSGDSVLILKVSDISKAQQVLGSD
jgi:hypothetical protein